MGGRSGLRIVSVHLKAIILFKIIHDLFYALLITLLTEQNMSCMSVGHGVDKLVNHAVNSSRTRKSFMFV